jgi:hypothetical protein
MANPEDHQRSWTPWVIASINDPKFHPKAIARLHLFAGNDVVMKFVIKLRLVTLAMHVIKKTIIYAAQGEIKKSKHCKQLRKYSQTEKEKNAR